MFLTVGLATRQRHKMAKIYDLCSQLLPHLAKNPTQTFRDHSINMIVQNKVFFDFTGKRFDNKINQNLFLIYINDLPPVVTSSKILLFADDAKCYKTVHNLSDIHLLQLNLDSLTN